MTAEEYMLTDDQFHEYVRTQRTAVISQLKTPDTSLMPQLVVVTREPDGKDALTLCALAVPFSEADEKQQCLLGIGKRMYDDQKVTIAIVLTSEAWISNNIRTEPRHDPQRREVVIVVGSGLPEKQRMLVSIPIRRDAKNMMLVDGEPTENPECIFPLLDWFWRGYFYKVKPQ